MEEITSNVPVMHFCEYCWATLKEDGTCPTEGCIHNDLMDLGEENQQSVDTSALIDNSVTADK